MLVKSTIYEDDLNLVLRTLRWIDVPTFVYLLSIGLFKPHFHWLMLSYICLNLIYICKLGCLNLISYLIPCQNVRNNYRKE